MIRGVSPVSENIHETETPEQLKPEDIEKLLEKAKDTEWKYLLKLREWARQGPAHTDYAEFKIVYGEAETVKIGEWDSGYPYERGWKYLLIPKTVPVVVLWEHVTDERQDTRIYVFTKDGWKEVEVQ
jgi:hypothetical protein